MCEITSASKNGLSWMSQDGSKFMLMTTDAVHQKYTQHRSCLQSGSINIWKTNFHNHNNKKQNQHVVNLSSCSHHCALSFMVAVTHRYSTGRMPLASSSFLRDSSHCVNCLDSRNIWKSRSQGSVGGVPSATCVINIQVQVNPVCRVTTLSTD